MVLRLTEKAKCIVHIPKVLYYWRVHSNSVSMDLGTKQYAVDAAIHAVSEQLQRTGETGRVRSNLPYQTIYRIGYDLHNDLISLLLFDASSQQSVLDCVDRVCANTDWRPLELVLEKQDLPICCPDDVTVTYVSKQSNKAQTMEAMAQAASGKYLCFYSHSLVPENKGWLKEMAMLCQREDVCAVGPKGYDMSDNILFAGLAWDLEEESKLKELCRGIHRDQQGFEAMLKYVRNVSALHGACWMVKKQTWQALGGVQGAAKGYETVEFCLKGRQQGLWNVWTPFAECKQSENQREENLETQAFEQVWKGLLREQDPYYHPNLKKLGLL